MHKRFIGILFGFSSVLLTLSSCQSAFYLGKGIPSVAFVSNIAFDSKSSDQDYEKSRLSCLKASLQDETLKRGISDVFVLGNIAKNPDFAFEENQYVKNYFDGLSAPIHFYPGINDILTDAEWTTIYGHKRSGGIFIDDNLFVFDDDLAVDQASKTSTYLTQHFSQIVSDFSLNSAIPVFYMSFSFFGDKNFILDTRDFAAKCNLRGIISPLSSESYYTSKTFDFRETQPVFFVDPGSFCKKVSAALDGVEDSTKLSSFWGISVIFSSGTQGCFVRVVPDYEVNDKILIHGVTSETKSFYEIPKTQNWVVLALFCLYLFIDSFVVWKLSPIE